MVSPVDYPDDHPGWVRLMVGMIETMRRRPEGHDCLQCRLYRKEEARRPRGSCR